MSRFGDRSIGIDELEETAELIAEVFHDPSGAVVNHPTNVTWGGADLTDLYIGSIRADYVLKARSPLPGQPQIHQKA